MRRFGCQKSLHFHGLFGMALLLAGACTPEPAPPTPAPTPPPADVDPSPPRPMDIAPRPPRPQPPAPVLPEGWTTFARDAITVAFSRDNTYLLTGDLGGHTAFQNVATGRLTWADLAKAGRIRHVLCATHADTCLASGFDGADLALRLYRTATLEAGDALGPAETDARSVAISADGTRVAAVLLTDPPALTVRDVGVEAPLLSVPTGAQTGGPVALSPDGQLVAFASAAGGFAVHRLPPSDVAPAPTWSGPADTVLETLLFAPSAPEAPPALLGTVGAEILAFELPADSATPTVRSRTRIGDDRFSIRGLHRLADGRVVAVTRPPEGGLVLWNAATGAPLAELKTACPCETHAVSFAVSEAAARVACSCADRAEVRHGPVTLPAAAPAP